MTRNMSLYVNMIEEMTPSLVRSVTRESIINGSWLEFIIVGGCGIWISYITNGINTVICW